MGRYSLSEREREVRERRRRARAEWKSRWVSDADVGDALDRWLGEHVRAGGRCALPRGVDVVEGVVDELAFAGVEVCGDEDVFVLEELLRVECGENFRVDGGGGDV